MDKLKELKSISADNWNVPVSDVVGFIDGDKVIHITVKSKYKSTDFEYQENMGYADDILDTIESHLGYKILIVDFINLDEGGMGTITIQDNNGGLLFFNGINYLETVLDNIETWYKSL